jgi:hypothetical protein
MHRLGQFIPGALAALMRKAPLSDEKVAFAWRTAVGSSMDRVTTVTLKDGVLRVRAKGCRLATRNRTGSWRRASSSRSDSRPGCRQDDRRRHLIPEP